MLGTACSPPPRWSITPDFRHITLFNDLLASTQSTFSGKVEKYTSYEYRQTPTNMSTINFCCKSLRLRHGSLRIIL